MTEYEMAALANEMQLTLASYGMANFTTVTAFLVASYLVAHKLNRFMVATVIAVYTVWLGGGVIISARVAGNLAGLSNQIAAFAEQGKGMQWHMLSTPFPPGVQETLFWVQPLLMLGVYAATLAFFFQCRRRHSELEAAGLSPG